MPNPFDLLIDSYLTDKIGIDPSFMTLALSKGLQEHIVQLQQEDKMTAAGIGNAEHKDANQTMRSDKIYWLDKSHDNIFEQEFLHLVENFIEYLNRTCYTGINGYEFHYAVYESGTYYKRHRDQFKNENHRKYSLINYLNDNWQQEDGGLLRVFQKNGFQNILPQSQKAVFFKSDEMEHEVTLSNRSRMSITGWLKSV